MTIRKRGPRTKIGGVTYLPMVEVTKSIVDDDGVAHEVTYRSRLGDGRYTYNTKCNYPINGVRRRWKDIPPNCLECIAATPLVF